MNGNRKFLGERQQRKKEPRKGQRRGQAPGKRRAGFRRMRPAVVLVQVDGDLSGGLCSSRHCQEYSTIPKMNSSLKYNTPY